MLLKSVQAIRHAKVHVKDRLKKKKKPSTNIVTEAMYAQK